MDTIFNMSTNNDVVIGGNSFDCLFQEASDGYDEVWGHSTVHSAHGPKISSMFLSKCEENYTERMKRLNDMIVEEDPVIVSNSVLSLSTQVELEYVSPKSQSGHVSKATNNSISVRQQYAPTADPILNQPAGSNMFNMQLNYDPNQALDPDF